MVSLGYNLRKARERKRLSVTQLSGLTKIQPKFIKAIEKNDYSIFSNSLHAKGFIQIISDYLGLNTKDNLAIWRRDYLLSFGQEDKKTDQSFKLIEKSKVLITPQLFFSVILSSLVIGFFIYLFANYKNFNADPVLQVSSPDDNSVVVDEIVIVVGETEPGNLVFINGQKVEAWS